MESVHTVQWPRTVKCLRDLAKELSCNKCLKPVISPKTFRNCFHFFCQACMSHSTNCPSCGVLSPAKDIYHDTFIENLAVYVKNIEKTLNSLLVENISDQHTEQNLKYVGNEVSHIEQVEKVNSPPKTLEPEIILTGPRRKRGSSRNATSCKKLSTGYLKSVSDTSVDSSNLGNDTLKESSRKSNNSDIKTPFRSDLDSSLVMVEKNDTGGKSRGNLQSGSKGAKFIKVGKATETSNPDFITPVKNMSKRSGESQIKNVSDTAKKAANKRNAKGETPLQVACKKGNLNQVTSLISDGANPNVKDNFGWTPLHEAIHYKHIEIAKELIVKGGAWVNTPGGENFTPLHKAVALNVIEGIKLLLESGANPKLVDIYGNIPIDYSQSDEVSRILENHSADITQYSSIGPLSKDVEMEEERVVFFGDGLSKNDLKLLGKLSSLIPGSRVSQSFTSDVTHVAVNEENGICVPSINVLSGILTRKHFVSIEWVQHSIKRNSIKHQHSPGVKSTKAYPLANGLYKAQMCFRKQLPSIFSGMHFAISSACRHLNYDNLKKDDIANLVALGNGHYHSREPDPESIPLHEKTVPFYANNFVSELTGLETDHPLKNCSHVILYHLDGHKSLTERSDPGFIKYNMAHFKSLPVAWFVGCIESFTLLDPSPFL